MTGVGSSGSAAGGGGGGGVDEGRNSRGLQERLGQIERRQKCSSLERTALRSRGLQTQRLAAWLRIALRANCGTNGRREK